MRGILVVLGCAALVAGCAAPVSVRNVTGPDGKQAYVMKCSGMGRDRSDCMAKAGELCPAGYTVADDNSRFAGAMVTGNVVLAANKEYMTVECK